MSKPTIPPGPYDLSARMSAPRRGQPAVVPVVCYERERNRAVVAEQRIAELEAERDVLAARGYEDAKSIIWSVMMFWIGNKGHHVLRLVENGIWSADKAAEVLRVLLHGTPVELPDVVADAVYCGDVDALAARDERMKREGALEALRELPPRHERRFGSLEYIRGWDAYREFVDAAIAALEEEKNKP